MEEQSHGHPSDIGGFYIEPLRKGHNLTKIEEELVVMYLDGRRDLYKRHTDWQNTKAKLTGHLLVGTAGQVIRNIVERQQTG